MKIEKLVLKDFRSHKEYSMDLDRFNFIVGPNAAGKSSIAQAIEFGLTGKCEFSPSGQGADDLIRIGAKQFEISMSIANGKKPWGIVRIKSPKGHLLRLADGAEAPINQVQGIILERIGSNMDVLSACLNAHRFVQMDPSDQKKLLAQVLASEKVELPAQSLSDLQGLGIHAKVESVNDIDRLYKAVYDLRTETNRTIKSLGPEKQKPEVGEDSPSIQDVNERLAKLRKELLVAQTEKTRAEEKYRAAIESISLKKAQLKSDHDKAEKHILPDSEAEELQAVANKRSELERLERRLVELQFDLQAKIGAFNANIAAKDAEYREKVRQIENSIKTKTDGVTAMMKIKTPECPTCQRELTSEEKGNMAIKVQGEIAALEDALEDLRHNHKQPEEPPAILEVKEEIKNVQELLTALPDIEAAESRLKTHRDFIILASKCEMELKAIKVPEEPDTSAYDRKIEELTARISKGEGIAGQIRDTMREVDSYNMWHGQKVAAENKLAVEERLLEVLGPNGIKKNLVGDKIGPFSEQVNAAIEAFGYKMSFSLEPYNFSVTEIDNPEKGTRSIRQLSESEEFRFGIAFQIALSMVTGVKLVVIDRADLLDTASRSQLTGMLMEGELDQALVLSTTDKRPPEQLPEGVKFFTLGNL